MLSANVPAPTPTTTLDAGYGCAASASLSVIALAEFEQGIFRLGETRRAQELRDFLAAVEGQFQGRVLSIDRRVAHVWAFLTAQAYGQGKGLSYADSLIAATARTYGLTVVTRNTRDFAATDVPVINPWDAL